MKDDEILVPKPDYTQLLSTRGSENSDLESQNSFRTQQPEEAGVFSGTFLEYSELLDVCQTSLGLAQSPWASMPFNIDTLVKMYALPGDDDPNRFDKYLFPGCLG